MLFGGIETAFASKISPNSERAFSRDSRSVVCCSQSFQAQRKKEKDAGESDKLLLNYASQISTIVSIQLTVKYVNFADGWIQTVDLSCRKQLLCLLSHNH